MQPGVSPKQPSVSVILPVFNGQEHLAQAIKSVLEQDVSCSTTRANLELIVVDDGSTDDSGRIAQSFNDMSNGITIRYIRQENKGVAAARNVGIGIASGELIAFIDADDLWTPSKLRTQVDALSAHPDLAGVMGKVQMFFERMDDDALSSDGASSNSGSRLFCGEPYYCYVLGSALIRRAACDSVGCMNESMKITSDMEWFVRLREQFHIETMDFVSLLYRLRPGSLTNGKDLKERNILSLIKQSLDRRRCAANGEAGSLR